MCVFGEVATVLRSSGAVHSMKSSGLPAFMPIRHLRSPDATSADTLAWPNDSKQNDLEDVNDGGCAVR
jgi:hypothetical protein